LSLTQAGKNLSLKPCTLTLKELEERLVFIQITPRQLVERESIDHGAAKVSVRNTRIMYEQLLQCGKCCIWRCWHFSFSFYLFIIKQVRYLPNHN
jgi:hypothetical protein